MFRKAPTRALAQAYLAAGICIAVWCAGAAALVVVPSATTALAIGYLLHAAVLFVPATTLRLSLLVAGIRAPRVNRFVYGVTGLLLCTMPLGLYLKGMVRYPQGWFAVAGPGFQAFSVLMPVIAIPMIAALALRRRAEQVNKRRFTVLMVANGLMILAGAHDCLLVRGFAVYPHTHVAIYPWGTYAATVYGALFAYAALQEHALDVRFSVGREAGAIVRLGITFGVGFVLLFALSAATGGMSPPVFGASLAALLLASSSAVIAGPWLLSAIAGSLHAQALSESSDYRAGVVKSAETLLSLGSYEEIWSELRQSFAGAVRIDSFAWFVVDAKTGQLRFAQAFPPGSLAEPDLTGATGVVAAFDRRDLSYFDVASTRQDADASLQAARRQARRYRGEFVFATTGAPDIHGALVVGPKAQGYSRLDIELLTHVAQRIGIAAQRVHVTALAARAERHELLSLMGRGLAHDLQNLLVPVRTYFDVVRRSPRLDERERTLHAVATENLSVVRAYLANAVLFGADMRLRLARSTVAALVSSAGAVVTPRAAAKSVQLRLCTEERELLLDPVLCERLMANLLANAIDASPVHGVVEVACSAGDPDDTVRFEVRDHGPGIPLTIQRFLFQPYFTTKGSGGDGARGFGLGLALCQMIVELHDGRIWFETKEGEGTVFFVELPRAPKHQDVAGREQAGHP